MPDDPRLEALETKLAHAERAIQDLSDVLYRHEQALAALAARHQSLLDRLASGSEESAAAPAQFEIPPHY